ncbi:hypothetical protein BH11PLA2_BH11PLA2_42010 [soil metagenome]
MEGLQLLVMLYGFVINICLISRLRYPLPAVLLIFVPFANLFALGVFAFRRAPLEDENRDLKIQIRALEATLFQQHSRGHALPPDRITEPTE